MKKTITTLAAVSALALGAPAAAQYAGGNFDARIQNLQTEIQAGVQAGTIRRDDARTLREHLRVLRQTERTYAMDGFTRTERQDLQNRIQNLRQQVRYAANVRSDYRYGQSGYMDRNRDGFDDRDFDRDGRWQDDVRSNRYGYSGMGGPYEEVGRVCGTGRGITGVIGAILGSDNCVHVGERVSNWNSLGALPWQYREQFRDGSGYYHRYLDGNVVQIDSRTGTVVRIYDVD
jgi:hypothetical protein